MHLVYIRDAAAAAAAAFLLLVYVRVFAHTFDSTLQRYTAMHKFAEATELLEVSISHAKCSVVGQSRKANGHCFSSHRRCS